MPSGRVRDNPFFASLDESNDVVFSFGQILGKSSIRLRVDRGTWVECRKTRQRTSRHRLTFSQTVASPVFYKSVLCHQKRQLYGIRGSTLILALTSPCQPHYTLVWSSPILTRQVYPEHVLRRSTCSLADHGWKSLVSISAETRISRRDFAYSLYWHDISHKKTRC